MELTITTNPTPEQYTICVTGEVDISNADKLRAAIDFALEQPTEAIQLDFEHVAYIDSTGVGVLVGAAHRVAEAGGSLVVARPQRNVARVLGLLGVQADLNIREA